MPSWILLEHLSSEDSDYNRNVREVNLRQLKKKKGKKKAEAKVKTHKSQPRPKKKAKIIRPDQPITDTPTETFAIDADPLDRMNDEFCFSSETEDPDECSDEVDSPESDDEPIFRAVRHPITGYATKLRSDVVKKIERVYKLKQTIAVNDADHLREEVERLENEIKKVDRYIYAKFIEGV